MIKKSLLIWLGIIPLAVLNGILREKVLSPAIGENISLTISGITLCCLILALSVIFIPKLGRHNAKSYLKAGLVWMGATVVFEFLMEAAMGYTVRDMLRAYDVTSGNLWTVVVLFCAIAPLLAARIRGAVIKNNA